MLQSQPIDPRGQLFQLRPSQIRNLTTKSKQLYSLLNIFELQMSRLMKLPNFAQCTEQLIMFNEELIQYKKDRHEIKNIEMTYHLYENLFSRLKYVANFSRSSEQANMAMKETMAWFYTQKPKLRCEVQQVKAQLKEPLFNPKQNQNIEDLIQYTRVKREMQPYESMSRTVHNEFFPPKLRLKQYKRKQLIPLESEEERDKILSGKKSSSTSALNKMKLSKFRQTMTTMVQTRTSFKSTARSIQNAFQEIKIKDFKTQEAELQANIEFAQKLAEERQREQQQLKKQQENEKQQQIIDYQLDVIERQKKVVQLEIMQNIMVQNVGTEDEPDEKFILDDEDLKQQKFRVKAYSRDRDEEKIMKVQQQVKQAQQSTLRRIMKINEQQMRSKMEDINIKRNMLTWGKVKGKFYKEKTRKVETLKNLNKYKNLEHKPLSKQQILKQDPMFSSTSGFKEKKKPVQIVLQYRSETARPQSLENQIQKIKFRDTLGTYQKYINHLNIEPTTQAERQEKQLAHERATSLTSFVKTEKKKSFSKLIETHRPIVYNEEAEQELIKIKTTLSGKSLPLDKVSLYRALSVVPPQQVKQTVGMYAVGKQLPTNPFFPKHLYGKSSSSKKKKKKKK